MRASEIPSARAAAVAAAAFSRLCAPGMSGSAGSSSAGSNSIRRAWPGHVVEAARHDRVVGLRLVLEDPELRVPVGVDRAVPVEMVGLEVEQHGDPRTELVDVLELEAGDLADDDLARLDPAVELRQRAADVAGDGRSEHDSEQLARRRLPVRPGHADDRVPEQPRAELDLAPDGNARVREQPEPEMPHQAPRGS